MSGTPLQGLATAAREGRFEAEGWRLRKDGSRFWANVIITAIHAVNKLVGFAKATRDLSDRKEAEESLKELARQLAQSEEDERQRLAQVLHDSTSPALAGALARLHKMKTWKGLDQQASIRAWRNVEAAGCQSARSDKGKPSMAICSFTENRALPKIAHPIDPRCLDARGFGTARSAI